MSNLLLLVLAVIESYSKAQDVVKNNEQLDSQR